ncbi:helix-turn-helix domain-containing protein [Bordetella ansorpii]|nr:helix-turn-helix domain-containing protein [Bordetella ansorpii]
MQVLSPPPSAGLPSEPDLNFAPRFRPFYEAELSGYKAQLDKLVLPGDFRALTMHPRLQLQACRLRAGGLAVTLESTPIAVQHRAEHAADALRAEFLASFIIEGRGVITQNGASLPVETGDIIFRTTALPSEVRMLTDSRLVVIKGSLLHLLGMHLQDSSQFTAQRAASTLPMVRTAHRCLEHVFFEAAQTSPASGMFAEQALLSLLAAIYTSQALEQIPNAQRGPLESWQALTSYLDAHIADPDLSVAGVARALRASSRWVHRLFQMQGTQYNQYVRERRLQLARAALDDPRKQHLAVKDIALSCGFQDASHFSRRFQQRFGCPPNRYRTSAQPAS